jgi:benzoyl-CoA reductase/2-hydroxyglutaryl-CoA dehydratase subunit BcrC/BadD/HgdB
VQQAPDQHLGEFMSTDYHEMWSKLGLNLAAHDQLLEVLGNAYQSVFLSQKNRPAGMGYFDFVMSEVHGLRVQELVEAQKTGRKVIGSFCVFVPEELILALDGISVGLCTGADFATEEVEKILPRNLCALIKSAFGFAIARVCPYLATADMVVGENTCDGKKKSYEQLKDIVRNLYVMDLPQFKDARGKVYLKQEYQRFGTELEKLTGKKLTVDNVKNAINIVNGKRRAIARLNQTRKANPVPISGTDCLLANQVYFYENPQRFTENVNKLCDEVEERVKSKVGVFPKDAPRILISGCPMAVPNWKLHNIIETSGAVVVGEESCVGERGTQVLTDGSAKTLDGLFDAITDRYFNINCAIFTPNPDRLKKIKQMQKNYKADGVIHYCLNFCTPYIVESLPVEKDLEANHIPTLRIETDYSQEDVGQLKTRIEAFIERIKK